MLSSVKEVNKAVVVKRFLRHIAISFACIACSGCATVMHGTTQEVTITTNPPEAIVSDGTNSITTPGTLKLKRNRDHILTISKPGYATETVQLTHVVSGAVAGNLLVGGLAGWGIDAISGAQWRLIPEAVSVTLKNDPCGGEAAIATPVSEQPQETDSQG